MLSSCFLLACKGKEPSATAETELSSDQFEDSSLTDVINPDFQTESEEVVVNEETHEGYSAIGGTWKVGGIYYKGYLIDINDNDTIKSMYDTSMITFNEDGTFVYLKVYNDRGMWSEKEQGSEDSFILKTESTFMYDFQDGALVEKETENSDKKQYIAVLLDENTFVLNEYDSTTGKAKTDDDPYIFVKQGEASKYIADNKTPINDSESAQSGTDEKPSQQNNTEDTTATSGEKNALARALQYLDYSAFSYSGLVEQLEYEGYSHSESTYAVDHCGANWKEQATKKALSYLDYSAFSNSGLIEQLEYEGFSSSEAQYGVDNCGADWKAQAAKKAEEYLQYSTFSRSELVEQLVFEGFTRAQAEYGVSAVY